MQNKILTRQPANSYIFKDKFLNCYIRIITILFDKMDIFQNDSCCVIPVPLWLRFINFRNRDNCLSGFSNQFFRFRLVRVQNIVTIQPCYLISHKNFNIQTVSPPNFKSLFCGRKVEFFFSRRNRNTRGIFFVNLVDKNISATFTSFLESNSGWHFWRWRKDVRFSCYQKVTKYCDQANDNYQENCFCCFVHMIKNFSSPKIKIWFEPMFFSGFFCGFERCGSAAIPNFRGPLPRRSGFGHAGGGTSSPPQAAKTVRTNLRILHHVGNCKFERFASLRSATNLYSILGVKTNSRFRILGEENFLIPNQTTI